MAQTYKVKKPDGIYYRGEHHKRGDSFSGDRVPSYFVRLGYVEEVRSIDVRAAKRKRK
jgi:hypothetical protein